MGNINPEERRNFLKTLLEMKYGKAVLAALAVVFYLASAYVVGYFSYMSNDFNGFMEKSPSFFSVLKYGIVDSGAISLIVFVIVVLAVLFLSLIGGAGNRVAYEDERHVQYDTRGMYGTARPMLPKEAKKIFEVGSIEKVQGPILGQFGKGGKEVICLSPKTDRNRNILVLGSPGTGKSFCYVRGAVFQAVRRGESVLVTDPKGEIYCDMAGFLRSQGYEVRVFDLVKMEASDAWDCMQEIFDPETGDLNQLRLNEFSATIFANTSQGKDDPFWGVGEKNLFNAIIAYTAFMYEKDLKRVYLRAAKMILSSNDPEGKKISLDDQKELLDFLNMDSSTTMNERRKIMRTILNVYLAADENSAPVDTANAKIDTTKGLDEQVDEAMRKIESGEWTHENGLHRCDIASIYFLLVGKTLDDVESMFENEKIPLHHVASIAWSIFKNGSDNVKPGFITGLTQRLYLFQMRDLRRITSKQSHDTIELERMGARKCAYFCVISDKSDAMRPISSLFFNFLFRDVADAADRYGPDKRIPVNVICDEFANLGAIPGFEVVIATVRSRKINISIILQSVSQLANVYGPENASTIIGCCDTILFLGCNDPDTAEFMSDLSGTASIRADSTKEAYNAFGNKMLMQGGSTSEGGGKRAVYNPDEVRRLDRNQVLIYHQGCNILKANRCGFIEHPYFKAGLPPKELLSERTPASIRFKENEMSDAFFANDINNARRAQEESEARRYSQEQKSGEDSSVNKKDQNKPNRNGLADGGHNITPTPKKRGGRAPIRMSGGGREIRPSGTNLAD